MVGDGLSTERRSARTVAYVMSRFPKLSETFVLYEMLAVEQLGCRVELFPLLREAEPISHPEARRLVERAHYEPFLSGAIVRSQLHFALRRPRAYFAALGRLMRGTLGSRNYFFGGLAIFPKVVHMARCMEALGVQHVHCHFASHPAAAGFVIHRLTGIPFTFTAHGTDLHRDQHMLRAKVADARRVVTISDYNRRLILRECGARYSDKVVVVRCGVDPCVFRPDDREPASRRAFSMLCVGRFEEVKGHRYLLEACRLLADEGIEFRCRFVGDGPTRHDVQRVASSLGLGGSVVMEGRRTRAEVVERLLAADVLVAPSVPTKTGSREGIPVVLMEAMSTALPVVASDLSGIPELVRHEQNGLLVPPGDPTALAAALRRLSQDRALRIRLGRAARQTILREYDLRRNVRVLAGMFAEQSA